MKVRRGKRRKQIFVDLRKRGNRGSTKSYPGEKGYGPVVSQTTARI